jgi:hypothetical protein
VVSEQLNATVKMQMVNKRDLGMKAHGVFLAAILIVIAGCRTSPLDVTTNFDPITGQRCTFFAFPWRWPEGEGCALRVVAVIDPKQTFRFETGR